MGGDRGISTPSAGALVDSSTQPWIGRRPYSPRIGECLEEGCAQAVHSRGMCRRHYHQWWRGRRGRLPTNHPLPEHCFVEGCERAPAARNYCSFHYGRWRHYGDPLAALPSRELGPQVSPRIESLLAQGLSLRAIALTLGVSHQRVDQLLNLTKHKARKVTADAVESGEVVKPAVCAHCFAQTAKLAAHHWNYTRPLQVAWFCPKCHAQLHVALRRAGLTPAYKSRPETPPVTPEPSDSGVSYTARARRD